MSLFSAPVSNDKNWFEAYILAVDSVRAVCKIQTTFGQRMDNVPWLSNAYDGPEFNDRVLVTTVTGSPIVVGILSRIGDNNAAAPQINNGDLEADTGNYSSLSHDVVGDPNKPSDLIASDKITSNTSGGLFGLLRGGTFVAKASRLAQVLISKYDDLVRVVARNWELFTDVCVDMAVSLRGRVYAFRGYAETLQNGRQDVYKYQEFYGDTVLGVNRKWNTYGLDPSTFNALPVADNIIRKYLIVNSGGQTLFRQDLNFTNGEYYTQVQNTAGTSFTYVDHALALFDIKSLGGSYGQVTIAPTSVVATYNGTNTITIDSSQIKSSFNNVNIIKIESSQITVTVGSNVITVDGSKITGVVGTASLTLDASKAELKYGVHSIAVTSTGVAMT